MKLYLEELIQNDSLSRGSFSFCLLTADSGKVLLEKNSNQTLVPASVLKIITTGTALMVLGNKFHFNTRLQHDGKIENRVLNGNLYIKGGGDPSLGSSVFTGNDEESIMKQWVEAIKKLDIDTIKGALIGDADIFDDDMIPAGYAWEDIQNDYGAGTCGLSFRENLYDIQVTCEKSSAQCKIVPAIPGLKLTNKIVINKSEPKSYGYASGAPYMNDRTLLGVVNGDCVIRSPIPDPPFFCAELLRKKLVQEGIVVTDSSTTTRKLNNEGKNYQKKERKTFHTTYSPSLQVLVDHTNHVSQNFYAESILKALSVNEYSYGTTAGGVNAAIKFWKDKGIDLRGFYMCDGSGVSRMNSVTVLQLASMLRWYSLDSEIFETFYNSLPAVGQSGTVRKIGQGTAAQNNVKAKSGYMSRVRTYAGYVTDKKGRLLCFAMIANNYEFGIVQMRDKFEKLMILMAELD